MSSPSLAGAFGLQALWVLAGVALVALAFVRLLTPAIYELGRPSAE